jgi:hypothetical protein
MLMKIYCFILFSITVIINKYLLNFPWNLTTSGMMHNMCRFIACAFWTKYAMQMQPTIQKTAVITFPAEGVVVAFCRMG